MTWLWIFVGAAVIYLLITLGLTFLVLQKPRNPVHDAPDWGTVLDLRIPSKEGGSLEVWRVEPQGPSRGIVVLAHGWGRNRGRMVLRARRFAELGFTTVIHSARDHGRSSRHPFMNAPRFADDIESVLDWIREPVLLYGHSIGAAAALIVAHRSPSKIKVLILEACYAATKEALLRLYRNYNRVFGIFFAPMVVEWMDFFWKRGLDRVSPVNLAPQIDLPVLIIHGEKDQNFPLHHAWRLRDSFPAGRAELFVAPGADHSSASLASGFPKAIRAFVERHLSEIAP
jgi:alpha-beta hydrolase superfamily lysophospholipase